MVFFEFLKLFNILKADLEANPLDKLPSILKKDLDKNFCVCNDVPMMEIINAIVNGATTVEEVKNRPMPRWGLVVVFNRSND